MATFNVNTIADGNDGSNAGSGISLRDVLIIANTNGDVHCDRSTVIS
ncbi:hypothetical protein Pse7367_3824 (plasmid) [Thalassoporum mexicanum PCC 7367]|nr:hypothetical protein [Pseudanabaena sp. PCC 7367]AFY72047.1 hypothetical protein Pse7367_3824 [Pseudanabaena sp. PCC 7367]